MSLQKYVGYLRDLESHKGQRIAEENYKSFRFELQELRPYLKKPLDQMDVLVLGCGYRYPDVELFTPLTNRTVGIDIIRAFRKDGLQATYRDIRSRESFIPSVLKTLLSAYESHGYIAKLRELSRTNTEQKMEVCSYDGVNLPFPPGSFDIVISNSVLEHVMDLQAVVSEISRVTKTDGLSYHIWHNYYSYSGGHAPPSLCCKHPWGHLRGKYDMPFLNRARAETVESLFEQYFGNVSWRYDLPEKVELLPTYMADLKQYSLDQLAHKSCIIIAQD
jgi:SAM-dependent methyltransferase